MNPATGSPVSVDPSSGWAGAAATRSTSTRVRGIEPVVAGEPAAVVDDGGGGVDAEPVQGAEHARDTGLEAALVGDREPDLAGQHLSALVVADREHPLDDLRQRRAATPTPARLRRRQHGRLAGRPVTCTPNLRELGRELVRRGRRRVGDPAVARGCATLVEPEGGDRRDDAVGHVVVRPVRVHRRAGEEGVVVGQGDPLASLLAQGGGGLAGQVHDVGAVRARRRRRPGSGSATGHRRRPGRSRGRCPARLGSGTRGRGRAPPAPPWP